MAREDADGTIEFGGRLDRQVKIRGYRIEPGEIEASVRQEPGVREVVVDVRPGPQGDGRLVAYVQVEAAGGRNLSELAKTAASRLPAYMVPAAWVEEVHHIRRS